MRKDPAEPLPVGLATGGRPVLVDVRAPGLKVYTPVWVRELGGAEMVLDPVTVGVIVVALPLSSTVTQTRGAGPARGNTGGVAFTNAGSMVMAMTAETWAKLEYFMISTSQGSRCTKLRFGLDQLTGIRKSQRDPATQG